MKKILVISITLLLVSIFAVSFAKSLSSAEKQQQVIEYLSFVHELNKDQKEIIDSYQVNFVQEKENSVALTYIKNNTLPAYTSHYEKTLKMTLTDNELQEIHSNYVEATKLQLEILNSYAIALDTNDENEFKIANQNVPMMNALFDQHYGEIIGIAKKHKININN